VRAEALRLLAALLALGGEPARAQEAGEEPPAPGAAQPAREAESAEALQAWAFEALRAGDYARAEALLRRQVEVDGVNFAPHYNLACALSLQGKVEEALASLLRAIEQGFVDLRHIMRDPDLAALRAAGALTAIGERWDEVLAAHRDANLRIARELFRTGAYAETLDEGLRLAYRSAFDPGSFAAAREEIGRLAQWGSETLFAPAGTGEPDAADAWVVVVLPSRRDFDRWHVGATGSAPGGVLGSTSQVGGLYSHDSRRLVAMDLGATLRHEFFHVLHWRHMTRLGQRHPVWIQEGLCALVEDYDIAGGRLEPAPSWRTNIARNMARTGTLIPLGEFVRMDQARFTGRNPLAHYAQARALFLFLHREGRLARWYGLYTETFASDPTGGAALERVFEQPLEEVTAHFRAWLRTLPEVPEWGKTPPPGTPMVGFEIDPGTGDGPVVASISSRSDARRAGLRRGDVITAIDGRATRDINELMRVLGTYLPGDRVTISYRRGRVHGEVEVGLVAR
jgi:tetratricopeptide (TPR) repeat protein